MNKKEILNEIAQLILNLFPFDYNGDDTINIEHPTFNEIKIGADSQTLELHESFRVPYLVDLNDPNWKNILLEILLTY